MAFTTPVVALCFGYVSLISPVANLLTLWAVSAAFTFGYAAVLLGLVIAPLGGSAGWLVAWPARYISCLLYTSNSGMAPMKPYFTGEQTPPRRRVCTCQKCVRTGDIENIGTVSYTHLDVYKRQQGEPPARHLHHEGSPELHHEPAGLSPAARKRRVQWTRT